MWVAHAIKTCITLGRLTKNSDNGECWTMRRIKGVCPDLISSSFFDVWQIVIGLNKFAKRCLLEEFIKKIIDETRSYIFEKR